MKKQLILIAALGLALQGCATLEQNIDKIAQSKRAQGIEVPEWKVQAAKDGCRSGKLVAGDIYSKFQKDYVLYKDNSITYKEIWDDSFMLCKSMDERNAKY